VYLVLAEFQPGEQSASVELTVSPLVNWVWFGFGVLGLGTLIALLPESTFAFATAPAVATQARTVGLLLLLLLGGPSSAFAQVTVFTALERSLRAEIKCTCGCRRSLEKCGMPNCHGEAEQMALMRKFIAQGMNRDQVLEAFVAEQGASAMMVPPRQGFNRTAWYLPLAIGAFGLGLVGVAARRWSRRPTAEPVVPGPTADPSLDARLDDELRDLD
jgi:cytochrome c-type biogenesis protein CcmH/NrfF